MSRASPDAYARNAAVAAPLQPQPRQPGSGYGYGPVRQFWCAKRAGSAAPTVRLKRSGRSMLG